MSSSAGPDLGKFLAGYPDLPASELLEVVLVDQRMRWKRRAGRPVEDYLANYPALAADVELVADLIYGQWRASGGTGPLEIPALLAARFPELSKQLSRQMELLHWLRRMADTTDGPTDAPKPTDRSPEA
jgi:hypothetical protein